MNLTFSVQIPPCYFRRHDICSLESSVAAFAAYILELGMSAKENVQPHA